MSLRASMRSRAFRQLYRPTPHALRASTSSTPFRIVDTCPSPTCPCSDTPQMPEGLEIDYKKPLNGTMASFAEQVVICTGTSDWKSNIVEDNSGDNLAADLKELLGRGGVYSDPFHNVSVLNSSFPSSIPARTEVQTTSAYLFPSFKYIPFLPRVSFDSVQALVKGYILPTKLNTMHVGLSPIHRDRLTRSTEYQTMLHGVRDVDEIMVMICGHVSRDKRCGIMGEVLQKEFETTFPMLGVEVLKGPVQISNTDGQEIEPLHIASQQLASVGARVGLVSHVGGHIYAGNVLCYIPRSARFGEGGKHPLAGSVVMYGRVEPKHVEGIITETLLKGKVIKELFRGGVSDTVGTLRVDPVTKGSTKSSAVTVDHL